MPFQVPHDLLMLGRTVAILSGMCTGLDVDFNLWDQLAPYAQKLIAEETGSNWEVWLDELGKLLQTLIALPGQAGRVMAQIERGDLRVQVPMVTREMQYLERAVNRLTLALIFVGLSVGGIILYTSGAVLMGEVFLGASLLTLAWTFFVPRRRF
jgi:predicted unusual protein kinase regulating ubiquinone biosynthesis (AarF/ABC1/UbiB family)